MQQLDQLRRLEGATGVVAIGEVGGVSHPVARTGDPVVGAQGSTRVLAVSAAPIDALGGEAVVGREFDTGHVARGDMVAIVDRRAAADMFLPDLRGRPRVFLRGLPFEVIGVSSTPIKAPEFGGAVLIPHTTASQLFGSQVDGERIMVIGKRDLLRSLMVQTPYIIRPDRPDTVETTALGDPVSLRTDVAEYLAGLVALVTGGAVMIGAWLVGVMSFVSVSERKQEFGLRRAVGARTGDVAAAVVIESLTVGFIGGILGLVAGVLGLLAGATASQAQFPLGVGELLVGPLMGIGVGAVAGVAPAWYATRIDPHTALTT